MLEYLNKHLDTPHLFSSKVSAWRVSSFTRALEEHQEIASDSDPHVVAAGLLLFLRMLPEPLLTFASYHPFLSCMKVEDRTQRLEEIKRLLQGLPVEHKCTLRAVMILLHRTVLPPNSDKNGANAAALASTFVKGVLRSYLPEAKVPTEPPEAVALVEELIASYGLLFEGLRHDETQLKLALQAKLERVRQVVEQTKRRADESDPDCMALLEKLFRFIYRVELRRKKVYMVSDMDEKGPLQDDFGCALRGAKSVKPKKKAADAPDTEEFCLGATRWEVSGHDWYKWPMSWSWALMGTLPCAPGGGVHPGGSTVRAAEPWLPDAPVHGILHRALP
jgi:hypothetical protein